MDRVRIPLICIILAATPCIALAQEAAVATERPAPAEGEAVAPGEAPTPAGPAATEEIPREPEERTGPPAGMDRVLPFYSAQAPWVTARLAKMAQEDPDRAAYALERLRRWMLLHDAVSDILPTAARLMLRELRLEQRRQWYIGQYLQAPSAERLDKVRLGFLAIADVESRLDSVLLAAHDPPVPDAVERIAKYRQDRLARVEEAIREIAGLAREAPEGAAKPENPKLPKADNDYEYATERYLDRAQFVAGIGLDFFLERHFGYDVWKDESDRALGPDRNDGVLEGRELNTKDLSEDHGLTSRGATDGRKVTTDAPLNKRDEKQQLQVRDRNSIRKIVTDEPLNLRDKKNRRKTIND